MPERHLLPIPLPHGRTGATGFLTIYFSPDSRRAGSSRTIPSGAHWADTVNTSTIRVEVDGVLLNAVRVGIRADPAIWGRDVPPRHGRRPAPLRRLVVHPAATCRRATSTKPSWTSTPVSRPATPNSHRRATHSQGCRKQPCCGPGGTLDAAMAYVRPMDGDRIEAPQDPEWDFHAYVSLLGHHPQLLRHLGLAVDVEVALPAAPSTVLVRTDYQQRFGAGGARQVTVVMHTTPDFHAEPNPDPALTEQARRVPPAR